MLADPSLSVTLHTIGNPVVDPLLPGTAGSLALVTSVQRAPGEPRRHDRPSARAEHLHVDLPVAGIDDGDERCGDLARRCRPLLEPLLLEWLADDEARTV